MKQALFYKFFLPYLFLTYGNLSAQIELSNFNATGRAGLTTSLSTDYQCLGINPANLAFKPIFERRQHTLGFAEVGFSAYTDALTRRALQDALSNPNRKFTYAEKIEAAQTFANSELAINLDVLAVGYGWQALEGGSGFAFNVRERIQWYSKFNPLTAEILFKGFDASSYFDLQTVVRQDSLGNTVIDTLGGVARVQKKLSEIMDGSRISMSWLREYNFGYGMSLINDTKLKLNVGIGGRLIQGVGILDLKAEKDNLDAFIAASPGFGIDFKDADNPSPSRDTTNTGIIPNAIGNGLGFDIGFSAEIAETIKLGMAVVNMGSINYKANVYTASDTFLTDLKTRGFENYNFFRQANQFDGFQQDMINWQGLRSIRTGLPVMFRLGGSYLIADILQVGTEIVVPLDNNPGNLVSPAVSIGGEFIPFDWLRISTGYNRGGNFGSRNAIPFGITFSPLYGKYECGISTRDVITYFNQSQPILSASFGFLRFRF
jgi:hypothetical protein